MPVSGSTALQALRDTGRLRAGQRVLVIGAGGGVGSFAVQLAKAFGAEVAGVCSAAKADFVRSLGADAVIDYAREDFADGRERYDVIVDTAGNRSLAHLAARSRPRERSRSSAASGATGWTGGFGRQIVRAPVLSLFVGQRLRPVTAKEHYSDLEVLRRVHRGGRRDPGCGPDLPAERGPRRHPASALRRRARKAGHHADGRLTRAA